ncbi:MAG: hypothetical protein HOM21_16945 [Halobacteriovoraceae bacterium]|jgi:hypothetical protein|nr:hypothetical protein [Halobacteriovoraceae bacterium]
MPYLLKSLCLLLLLLLSYSAIASSEVEKIADSMCVNLSQREVSRIQKLSVHFTTTDRSQVVRNLINSLNDSKSQNGIELLEDLKDTLKQRVITILSDGKDLKAALELATEQVALESSVLSPKFSQMVVAFSRDYYSRIEEADLKGDERFLNDNSYGEELLSELQKSNEKNNSDWKKLYDDKDDLYNGKNDPVFGGVSANGVRFPAFPRRILNRDITTTGTETFSAQVKVSFLGAELTAGPKISFERRFVINAKMMASGNEPIIVGNSELGAGVLNHSDKRRIVFFCTATAQATHKLSGSAGLTVFGAGATVERGQWESISVQQTSDLAYVPFQRKDGRRTNLKDIETYCMKTFYKQTKNSLKTELKLASSELVYSHSQTQCVYDRHCVKWHRGLLGIIQPWTVARCRSSKIAGEPVFLCKLRGKKGNACSVYDSEGTRLTAGYFEYPCDKGLKCSVTKKGGWFTNWSIHSYWEAKCK